MSEKPSLLSQYKLTLEYDMTYPTIHKEIRALLRYIKGRHLNEKSKKRR